MTDDYSDHSREENLEAAITQLLKMKNQEERPFYKKYWLLTFVIILVVLLSAFIVIYSLSPIYSMSASFESGGPSAYMDTGLESDKPPVKEGFNIIPAAWASSSDATQAPMKVFRAYIEIEVRQITDEIERVKAMATELKGYVTESSIQQDDEGKSASIEVRIPSEKYGQALSQIESMGELLSLSEEVSDVTMEFIDNAARLKNLKQQEQSIAGLLDRQGKLSDILAIEKELARIRGDIESLEGRQNYLENQVAFSTISLTISEKAPLPAFKNWPVSESFAKAKRGFLYLGRAIISAIIYALVFSPYALGIYVIYLAGRYLRRRRGREG